MQTTELSSSCNSVDIMDNNDQHIRSISSRTTEDRFRLLIHEVYTAEHSYSFGCSLSETDLVITRSTLMRLYTIGRNAKCE